MQIPKQLYIFLDSMFTGTSAFCPAPEPKSPSSSETFISCNGGANLCMNGVRKGYCSHVYTPVTAVSSR